MKEKLQRLLKNSYSPYSHFAVAAIVVMRDGTEFTGVNVENASYGAAICAERTAILKAVSEGYHETKEFKELHVMVDSSKISSCCFVCRQVITEFFSKEAPIYLYNNEGIIQEYTVEELCPLPFSKEDLK